jgi:hypothetical protein
MLAEIIKLLRRLPWWRPYWRRKPVLPLHMPAAEAPLAPTDEPLPPKGNGHGAPVLEDGINLGLDHTPAEEEEPKRRTMPWAGGTRGKYDTETGKLRRDVAETAALVLERFEDLRARDVDYYESRSSIKLAEDLLGNDFYLADQELFERMQGGSKYLQGHIGGDDKIKVSEMTEACWPVSFGVVGLYEDDLVALYQIDTVDAKAVRGRVKMVVPKMMRLVTGVFGDNGAWHCDEYIVGLIGERWVALDKGMEHRHAAGPTLTSSKKWAFGASTDGSWEHQVVSKCMTGYFETRYYWHVAFGSSEHQLRIVLPTNPTGALKLFKDRALDQGRTRREALRHWVAQHYREDDAAGSVYIRDHLRGNTHFNWSTMPCELMVSAFDLEKNEAFKHEAALWRANRKHNSVRIRLKRKPNPEKGDK